MEVIPPFYILVLDLDKHKRRLLTLYHHHSKGGEIKVDKRFLSTQYEWVQGVISCVLQGIWIA